MSRSDVLNIINIERKKISGTSLPFQVFLESLRNDAAVEIRVGRINNDPKNVIDKSFFSF